jgi:FixJ family two-component response regulator
MHSACGTQLLLLCAEDNLPIAARSLLHLIKILISLHESTLAATQPASGAVKTGDSTMRRLANQAQAMNYEHSQLASFQLIVPCRIFALSNQQSPEHSARPKRHRKTPVILAKSLSQFVCNPKHREMRMSSASTVEGVSRSFTSAATPIVFVVDDDVSVRESLELLIRSAGWQPEIFETAEEFLSRPRVLSPSCLVLDITLPDLNGLDLQRRIAADRIDMPIIFISGHGDVPMTVQAMKAGAIDFLTKPFSDVALLSAIKNAVERSEAALRVQLELRSLRERYETLSRREREVMALVVRGLLNKQVGFKLGISEITVKAHRGQVMRKMKAASLVDLANIARRLDFAP